MEKMNVSEVKRLLVQTLSQENTSLHLGGEMFSLLIKLLIMTQRMD